MTNYTLLTVLLIAQIRLAHFLSSLQELCPLGPQLDTSTPLGGVQLLQSFIQAYRLLYAMKANLADLPTPRLALYIPLVSGDGR